MIIVSVNCWILLSLIYLGGSSLDRSFHQDHVQSFACLYQKHLPYVMCLYSLCSTAPYWPPHPSSRHPYHHPFHIHTAQHSTAQHSTAQLCFAWSLIWVSSGCSAPSPWLLTVLISSADQETGGSILGFSDIFWRYFKTAWTQNCTVFMEKYFLRK